MNDLIQSQNSGTNQWFKGLLFAGMMVFAFYASTHMVAAGDTWVAMACGRHFDNHGVDTVEPFSFNSHPAGPSDETLEKYPGWTRGIIKKLHPTGWINQNWLTHLIFYKLATWFGDGDSYNYNTLVYWKFAIYFLAVICVYATGRLIGAGAFLSAAGACFAMVIGRTFYDIRPSGYSNLLVPVLLLIFALTVYRNYRWIWLTIPLVVFWANVHGGYLYAFIMLAPFVGIHLLLRLPRRWSICLGFVGLWLVLYLMSYKFISNNHYLQIQKFLGNNEAVPILFKDKILIVWVILAAISIVLTVMKNIQSAPFYAYHIGAGIIYFLSIAPRFFLAEIPRNLNPQYKVIYSDLVSSSQVSFLFVFVIGGLLILAMAFKKERFIALPAKGIYHTIGAGIVSFIAMIIFNPFHLTNLTHTFEISVSKHAESWRQVNEWKPAFDWMDKTTTAANPVGNEEAFAVLCILTGIVLLLSLIAQFLKPKPATKRERRNQPPETQIGNGTFKWPKIDLAMIAISLLTMYMAVRSRRFIAIAGVVAAPTIFLLLKQLFENIPRIFNTILSISLICISAFFFFFWNWLFENNAKLVVSWHTRVAIEILVIALVGNLYFLHNRKPNKGDNLLGVSFSLFWGGLLFTEFVKFIPSWYIQYFFRILIVAFNLLLGTLYFLNKREKQPNILRYVPPYLFTTCIFVLGWYWISEYKRIYLEPWPTDDRYNSVFMRMTASHLKPFEVCEFINDNQISGRVFNYWTEGGAVAFGQNPDPETGQIPLKLFMDGRAQAAYNHDTFRLWQFIHSGGPVIREAKSKQQKITSEILKRSGQWIDAQLKKHDVWVVLMPKSQENSTFMKVLRQTANWKTAYLDNTQHMLVNIETPPGRKLLDRILKDEAVFPDAYSKNMTTSTVIIENNYRQRFGDLYPMIKEVFDARPTPPSAIALSRLNSMPALRTKIAEDFQAYLDDFLQHKDAYRKQDGYYLRLASADVSARFLLQIHPERKKELAGLSAAFERESKSLNQAHVW